MRFDGKAALITGSSRGLGKAYATLLASLGASVAVNSAHSAEAAEKVVEEITAAGGKAVSVIGNVATDAESIVQKTVDEFGHLDIVINNAGIDRPVKFDENALDQIRDHINVNYLGTVAITAAAWPHLVKSGAGRIVNTSSPTLAGFEEQTPYVGSKGAVFAFTRTLAIEALEQGIKVNAVAPTAFTQMAEDLDLDEELATEMREKMTTEMVAALVVYLAHENCSVTGETILSQAGLYQRYSLSVSQGYRNPEATVDDIDAHIGEIMDNTDSIHLGRIGTDDGYTNAFDLINDALGR